MGETRDDQFLALPKKTASSNFGVCADFVGDPALFYQTGIIGSGQTIGVFGQQGLGKGLRVGLRGGIQGEIALR